MERTTREPTDTEPTESAGIPVGGKRWNNWVIRRIGDGLQELQGGSYVPNWLEAEGSTDEHAWTVRVEVTVTDEGTASPTITRAEVRSVTGTGLDRAALDFDPEKLAKVLMSSAQFSLKFKDTAAKLQLFGQKLAQSKEYRDEWIRRASADHQGSRGELVEKIMRQFDVSKRTSWTYLGQAEGRET